MGRRTMVRRATMGRTAVKVIGAGLVAGLAVLLSTSADAGLRFGPGAILGLVGVPLRMMTHGLGGAPEFHRHAAHESARSVAHAPSTTAAPSPAPVAHVAPNPPVEPPAVEARAEPAQAVEPARPLPPVAPIPSWPTAFPSVYEDLLGYVLWPGDYADRLWTHGYGDIMDTLLAPMAAGANRDQTASQIQNGMCSTKASELADRLIARTREIIGPTPDQKAALDELGSALSEAIDRGRTAVCAGTGDPLKRTVDGLWTMWDATLLMRAPLEKFYDSLTPAQKAKLAGGASAGQALARACADQRPADGPGDRLEQALRSDQQQRPALEALRQQSSELVQFLAQSYPR